MLTISPSFKNTAGHSLHFHQAKKDVSFGVIVIMIVIAAAADATHGQGVSASAHSMHVALNIGYYLIGIQNESICMSHRVGPMYMHMAKSKLGK